MNKKILFLTLRIFSATGGIEKVCKVVSMALNGLSKNLQVFSMYDKTGDADEKYIEAAIFRGYNQQKIKFVWDAVMKGTKMDVIIVSHINILSIGYIIKLLSPKTKLVLYAHGIEVWGPLSIIRKKMLQKCDTIIAVSNFTKEKMIVQYKLANEKLAVINNCIDPYLPVIDHKEKDESLKNRYHFSNNDIILLTLTRLSSKELYKGYDNVLISLTHLKDRFPNVKYLIVGKYDIAEKNRLDKIISDYSLQQYVVFSGYVHDEELAKHYCLADIYVMPSKKEGFGIVFVEAMHYGLPVIAGNKDGSKDALLNGRLGILVDPDNQEEIDAAVEKIIVNRQQYIPDRNLLAEAFSFSSYKEKLSSVFNQL
ncbi:MAG: glycosyltransferase family 4 protein [Bacteroidota bacterium]